MSRKNNSRLSKKHKRKIRKCLKKEEHAVQNLKDDALRQIKVSVHNAEASRFKAGQRPSTSGLQRSPWKNGGGKVKRFKKIIDIQARKLDKQSVYIRSDNHFRKNVTPKNKSVVKLAMKRRIKKNRNVMFVKKRRNTDSSLEEGEILSETTTSLANTTTDTIISINDVEDDDDCVIIEPVLDEIKIIDDQDNDNVNKPSTSDVSTHYESLISSFKECVSSTPCQKKTSFHGFYIDVNRQPGIESINSPDNFVDYTKLSTLTEDAQKSQHRANVKDADSTLKRKSIDCDNESVVFVSETNKNDFISIVDETIQPKKILKTNVAMSKSPANRLRTNNLFTQSETKKLHEYNNNAYNPDGNKNLVVGRRMVIIDGSNVAFKHALDQAFSVKGLKIAVEYFEKMGHEVKAVIPQYRMHKRKSTDSDELEILRKSGKIVLTPCKNLPGLTSSSYDDRFILQLAFELDAAIISNDNYRDLIDETPAFKKIIENRVIGYTWCNDIFILPKDPYGKWGPNLHSILHRS